MRHLDIKFTEEQRDELVIDIISDVIMYEKVINAVDLLAKVYNPNVCDGNWDGDTQSNGILKAFPMMGFHTPKTIEEENIQLPITYRLSDIFEVRVKRNESGSRKNANELAEEILREWKEFLKAIQIL